MTTKRVTRASREELEALHAQVAATLHDALTRKWTDTESGEDIPPPAALINVAVNFLKANGITGAAVTPKKIVDFLGDASMPFAFEDAIEKVKLKAPVDI